MVLPLTLLLGLKMSLLRCTLPQRKMSRRLSKQQKQL